jgi:hypothetical protein
MILSTHGIVGSQIQSFVGLLDTYPNAASAYSVRKLRTAYTGNAIRVRRTDLTESDIGFTATGNLDTTALLAFTGTGILDNGFVTTWYDQSGNARNATQTTALNQPQIVSAGSVLTLNSKPRVNFNSKVLTYTGFGSANFTIVSVIKQISTSNYSSYLQNVDSTFNGFKLLSQQPSSFENTFLRYTGQSETATNSRAKSGTSISNAQYLENWIFPNNPALLYENNVSQTVTSSVQTGWGAGNSSFGSLTYQAAAGGQFDIQELIVYTTNESSNINGINTNVNTYYAIY